MNVKLIDSVKDPYYQQALTLYDSKLGIKLQEDAHIFKRSLENNKTENDYSFIVGLNEHQQVVSMATAHYEATTNSAFLIYLLAQDGPEHDNILDETLTHIEAQINSLSNKVHNRNVNFIMLEVPQTTPKEFDGQKDILHSRRQFYTSISLKNRQTFATYIRIILQVILLVTLTYSSNLTLN